MKWLRFMNEAMPLMLDLPQPARSSPCQASDTAAPPQHTAAAEGQKPPGRWRITPASTNANITRAALDALGITYAGFDHQARAYIGCVLPPEGRLDINAFTIEPESP